MFIKRDKAIKYENEPLCSVMKITKVLQCFSQRNPAAQKLQYGISLSCEGIPETEIVIRPKDLAAAPSPLIENEAIEKYIETARMFKRKD